MSNVAAARVSSALKRRFPGPNGKRDVARILGIDSSLISGAAPEPAGGNGNGDSEIKKLKADIEALLAEGNLSNRIHESLRAELLELLKRAAPSSVMADDDEDDEGVRRLAEFLKTQGGFGADDIEKACDFARRARDQMPANAL
jgi:hypothetical protein